MSPVCRDRSDQPGNKVRLALLGPREPVDPKGQEGILDLWAPKDWVVCRAGKARRGRRAIVATTATLARLDRQVLLDPKVRKVRRAFKDRKATPEQSGQPGPPDRKVTWVQSG